MTREEIAKALGREVPASIVKLAEAWADLPDLLGRLRTALSSYGVARERVEDEIGEVPDHLWDLADELGHVHGLVEYLRDDDVETEDELRRLIGRLRTLAQAYGPHRRQAAATKPVGMAATQVDLAQSGFDPSLLLSEREVACARTIRDYWACVLGADSHVRGFRAASFGDPARTLRPADADRFIASPLVGLCSFRDLQEVGVRADARGARVAQWEHSREQYDCLRTDYEHEHPRRAPGLALGPGEARVYRFVVELPGTSWSVKGTALTPPDAKLSWIPYMPLDADPYNGDEVFPTVLPGSVAHDLASIAAYWAARLPWQEWEVAMFIVSGELPVLRPIEARIRLTATAEARERQRMRDEICDLPKGHETPTFARQMRMASTEDARLRGAIELVIEPWVSEETVRRCYSQARAISTGPHVGRSRDGKSGGRSGRPTSGHGGERTRLPEDDTLTYVRRATENGVAADPEVRVSLRSLFGPNTSGYTNGLRSYKRALETLDLDSEPMALLKRPTERRQ